MCAQSPVKLNFAFVRKNKKIDTVEGEAYIFIFYIRREKYFLPLLCQPHITPIRVRNYEELKLLTSTKYFFSSSSLGGKSMVLRPILFQTRIFVAFLAL